MKIVRVLKPLWDHKEGDVIEISDEQARYKIRDATVTIIGEVSTKERNKRYVMEHLIKKFVDDGADNKLLHELQSAIADRIHTLEELALKIGQIRPDEKYFNLSREYLCPIGDVRHTITTKELLVFKHWNPWSSGDESIRRQYVFMARCDKDRAFVDVTEQVEMSLVRKYERRGNSELK